MRLVTHVTTFAKNSSSDHITRNVTYGFATLVFSHTTINGAEIHASESASSEANMAMLARTCKLYGRISPECV